MNILGIGLAVLAGLTFVVWLSRNLMIDRTRRMHSTLTPADPRPQADPPRVSVLIAAKDEQDNIEACVRSMLSQDYPDFEVIVIDDRSVDRTNEIVRQMAAADSRVRLIEVSQLPPGWCGKSHAMWLGAAQVTGQWLCMIDADCRQVSQRTLSVAVRHAMDHEVDLLSVLPKLEMKGFWENVIQPICSGVLLVWYPLEKVNSPRHSRAYANGAFMLFRRSAYLAIGGHETVKDCLMEDMHLAWHTKQAGLCLRVVVGEGLYVVRMYTSLKQIVDGWCRIFHGTLGTKRRLRISLIAVVLMGLLPYAVAALAWPMWAVGFGTAWLAAALAGSAAVAMQQVVIARFYRLANARAGLCWTYPLGCLFAATALAKAYGKHRPGAKLLWRNTAYTVGDPGRSG
ncbi:MAG: glycosyltransferase [Planctomycetes bacterium]|nr:glycosyltransferase [Planctomycetota bacterium]